MKKNKDEIKNFLKETHHRKVRLAVVDIDGVLRGKVVSVDKFMGILDGGMGFCAVVFGWDMEDKSYDNVQVTGWHTGYPDFEAKVDPATLRKIPWDNNLPFFLADFSGDKGKGAEVCPRSLLKNVKAQAEVNGFQAQFSQEFEWFNFEMTPDGFYKQVTEEAKPMTPGMFGYSILRSSLKQAYFNDLFDLAMALISLWKDFIPRQVQGYMRLPSNIQIFF